MRRNALRPLRRTGPPRSHTMHDNTRRRHYDDEDDASAVARLRRLLLVAVVALVATFAALAGVGASLFRARPAERSVESEYEKAARARIECEALLNLADVHRIHHGDYPDSLDRLSQAQPDGREA